MDLYKKMGSELRDLFKDLFSENQSESVRKKMTHILLIASKIGGQIEIDAKVLHAHILKFQEHPKEAKYIEILKSHALKIEGETREI